MWFCFYLNESFDCVHLLNRRIRVIKVKRHAFLRFANYLHVLAGSFPFPAFSPNISECIKK